MVIRVENLAKRYVIRHQAARSGEGLRHAIEDAAKAPLRAWRNRSKGADSAAATREEFWALKDVSFEIEQGEVVGIIGRNGAGKSTLLKILSRITEPTEGRVGIKGRVASLLEVGTGFHPELTGRENIFLNGAILGMSRAEIRTKFDEIVDFAGVEKFLDTPVKRYSSGMYVRLAFAVAAHLEPEILVVDEVLAVGDAEFQKKCLGKMQDVAGEGRTVLFVSHNMAMINSLCQRAIVLERGAVQHDASASEAVLAYYNSGKGSAFRAEFEMPAGAERAGAFPIFGQIEDGEGNPVPEVDFRHPFRIRMRYRVLRAGTPPPYPNFHLTDNAGNYVFVTAPESGLIGSEPGVYEATCLVPGRLLNCGTFFVGLALTFSQKGIEVAFWEKDALCLNVVDPIEETIQTERNGYAGPIPGPVRPRLDWSLCPIP